jgi:nucleotide-binding universal stress UspA family protein
MNEPIRITCILVPVDGSEFSRYAAEHAARIAQAYSSELVFLHVVDDQIVGQLAHGDPDDGQARARTRLVEQGHIYLRDVARLAEERGLAHREVVSEGDPCAVICDTALRSGANLIVIGKIGRRGARRILVGSITRRVIECTELPILIVTGPPEDGGAGNDAAQGTS